MQFTKHIKSFAALMMVMMLGLSLVGTAAAASDISGTVTDADGNAVADATVEVVDGNGTVVASATTGSDGSYSITGLSDSTSYTIEVTADGFADYSQSYTTGSATSETVDISLSPEYTSTLTPEDGKTPSKVYAELGNTTEATVTVEAKVDGNWTTVNSKTVTPSSAPRVVGIDVSGQTNATEYRVTVSGQEPTDYGIGYSSGGGVIWTGSGSSIPSSPLLIAGAVAGGAYLLLRDN